MSRFARRKPQRNNVFVTTMVCMGFRCRLHGALAATLLLFVAIEIRAAGVDSLWPMCAGCHGRDGAPQGSEIPIISGQPFTVIEDALILFADGKRPCTVMCAIAGALSRPEMEALANYLEQQAFVPAEQEFDPARASQGREIHHDHGCESCHFQGGRESRGVAPILAGQQTQYLRRSLLEVRRGARSGPQVMNAAVQSLRDDEIEALLSFWARGQNTPDHSDTAGPGSRHQGNGR